VLGSATTLLALTLVVSLAAPASAHGETGVIAAEITPDADDPTSVTVTARVTYENDGEPVEDEARVTYQATGDGPNALFPSEDMRRVDAGEYELRTTFPGEGSYSLSVLSEDPTAAFETTYTVQAQTTTTTNGSTTTTTTEADGGDDDGVTLSWPVVVGILLFLAAVGGVVIVAVRQRRV